MYKQIFKQLLIMILFFSISYFISLYHLKKNYRTFYFIDGIIKYPLKCTIKNARKCLFSEIIHFNKLIFYTTEKINPKNYIYDISKDYYYLIEPGYYYYIKNISETVVHFDPNSSIFIVKLNKLKLKNKIKSAIKCLIKR
jgi:hypothetical protein